MFPEKKEKSGIFDRMDLDTDDEMPQTATKRDITFKVVGLDKPTGSIFSRLGDKSRTDGRVIESTPSHAGILKNSPTKRVGIVKKASAHRVISVKRVPAKATTMVADEVEQQQKMELCEPQKSVSFSHEDEVVEFASRRASVKPKGRIGGTRSGATSVRSRLGLKPGRSSTIAVLHKTRKTIKMKPGIIKSKLRSDDIASLKTIPVHSRLDLKRRSGTLTANALAARIGEVTLNTIPTRRKDPKQQGGNSVFHRLGFSGNANHWTTVILRFSPGKCVCPELASTWRPEIADVCVISRILFSEIFNKNPHAKRITAFQFELDDCEPIAGLWRLLIFVLLKISWNFQMDRQVK